MRITFAVITALFVAVPAAAADFKSIDALVQPLLDNEEIVGCVVGIIDGTSKQVRGYGSVRRGSTDPPTGDTIYEVGSVTKAFTGTLLADSVRRDEVKLDTPLQDLLPERVKLRLVDDKPIRLVDLASHTSGLPRIPDGLPKDPNNPYADFSPDKMFDFLARHQLRRPPGEYEYSNFGMGLLGHLLADKAGMPYEKLVIERICMPLKMQDTRITLSEEQRKRLAPPYFADLTPSRNWHFDALAGCGALRSTANDLLKLVEASLADNDRPIVQAIHEAWKPRYDKPKKAGVGLGWHFVPNRQVYFHDGQTGGYSSAVWIFPAKKLGIVVLCNSATAVTNQLGDKCLQFVAGRKPKPITLRPSVKVDPATLKAYEGTYALSIIFAITITVEDGRLMAQATGQNKHALFAESDSKFFYKVVDATIKFEKGSDGKVGKLVLHQFGRDMTGFKLQKADSAKN